MDTQTNRGHLRKLEHSQIDASHCAYSLARFAVAGRSQPMTAEVAEVIQARTALLGRTLETANSLRVTARHGEAPGGVEADYPVPLSATQSLSPHDSWAARTIPAERTSSTRTPAASASESTPSAAASQQVYNSRQTTWDSEYLSQFCDAQRSANWPSKAPTFMAQSLRDFSAQQQPQQQAPDSEPKPSRSNGRPVTPTQPLAERVCNERVSVASLESMQRPVHRKTYEDLADEHPSRARPSASHEPYSFDMNVHIERMRPAPLFKGARAGGVPQSEHLQNTTLSISQLAAQSLGRSATSTR